MRTLCLIITAAFLAGCHIATDDEIARDPKYGVQAQVCAAFKVAVRKDLGLPADAHFYGNCDLASSDGRDFTVAMRVKIPPDANGPKPEVFYRGDAEVQQPSGIARAYGLVRGN